MSDISIKFGNVQNMPKLREKSEQQVTENKEAPKKPLDAKELNGAEVLNFMGNVGNVNLAHLQASGKAGMFGIDVSKYVDDASRARIEKSMKGFKKGVEESRKALDTELANVPEYNSLGEAQKEAMAAEMFANM